MMFQNYYSPAKEGRKHKMKGEKEAQHAKDGRKHNMREFLQRKALKRKTNQQNLFITLLKLQIFFSESNS